MNRIILALICLISLLPTLEAQNIPPEKQEQLEAFKVAFITRRLSLTPAEAKVFWPVYDAYQTKMEEIRRENRQEQRLARADFPNLSDQELEAIADDYQASQKEKYELRASFHESLKEVLPIRKVVLFYKTEADLNRELLRRLQEARQNRN